jgi:REP element-mobilizing transposase RayT
MSQSLSAIYLHLIWSTKERSRLIIPSVQPRLHEYFGGVLRDVNCPAVVINSEPDHVHILCRFSRKIEVSELMEELKTSTSKWMKRKDGGALRSFYWQKGYGAFSVSASHLDEVANYIRTQQEHHRKRTFQEEYRLFLERYRVDYDERYFWD